LTDLDSRDLRETDYVTTSGSRDRYQSHATSSVTLYYDEVSNPGVCPARHSNYAPPSSRYPFQQQSQGSYHHHSSSSGSYYPPPPHTSGNPVYYPPTYSTQTSYHDSSSRGYYPGGQQDNYWGDSQMQRPSDFYNSKFNRVQYGGAATSNSIAGGNYYDYQHSMSGGGGGGASMSTTVDGERCLHSCVRNQDAGFYYCQIDREGTFFSPFFANSPIRQTNNIAKTNFRRLELLLPP